MNYQDWLTDVVSAARREAFAENYEWETGYFRGLELALDKYRQIESGVTE